MAKYEDGPAFLVREMTAVCYEDTRLENALLVAKALKLKEAVKEIERDIKKRNRKRKRLTQR
jgi:hypothetical protein